VVVVVVVVFVVVVIVVVVYEYFYVQLIGICSVCCLGAVTNIVLYFSILYDLISQPFLCFNIFNNGDTLPCYRYIQIASVTYKKLVRLQSVDKCVKEVIFWL